MFYYVDYEDGDWCSSTFMFLLYFRRDISLYIVFFSRYMDMAQDLFCAFGSCDPKHLTIDEHSNGVLGY